MDELSPAGVDNHYAVLHLTDGVVVNQVSGLLRERAVQGDDVRAAVQFVQRGVYHLVLAGEIVVGIQVVGEDVHAETAQDSD